MTRTFKTQLAKCSLLLCFCLLVNAGYSQADETITICNGEEVTLNLDINEFDIGDSCVFCDAISFEATEWYANNLNVSSEESITVSPTETTIYEVQLTINVNCTLGPICQPPKSFPPTITATKIYHVEVMEDCGAAETITICKGEETTISLDVNEFSYNDGCTYCNGVNFENITWIQNGQNISNEESLTISPMQTSFYEGNVSVFSDCGILDPSCLPPGAVLPVPYRSYTKTYKIEVTENCDPTEEPLILIKYPWLSNIVDLSPAGCAGTSIIEYDAGSYNFIYIKTSDEGVLYFENGTFYCRDQPGYSCVNAYNLTNIVDDSFRCNNSSTPGCTDPNASNYDPSATEDDGMCEYDPIESSLFSDYPWLSTLINANNCTNESITLYDAGSYNFLEIKSATSTELYFQNGTYYCADAPGYSCAAAYSLTNVAATWSCGNTNNSVLGCTDPAAINYNPTATENDGSCIYQADCNNYNGTFFFEDCGGTNYYFIQLEDGRIFDPYFADDISFIPFEGQQVNFDFVYNTEVSTPCSVSEAPITITCIEEVSGNVFEVYPWLSNIVDQANCDGTSLRVYDAGSYDFISIQSTSGTDLYYQNGTFYCSDAPGYSCIEAYNLSNVKDTWICAELPNDVLGCTDSTADNYNPLANINDGSCTYSPSTNYDFTKYPWLNTLVNPINCSQQPMVTEYDFGNYAFIYVKTVNGGSLYRNDGVFYCSDEDGQSCLNNYNLTDATTTWTCGNGIFQNFDYTYTICAGDEVTLRPDYTTNFISCICPPCAPVGPPAPPIATWMPLNACPNNNCFSTTVSPSSTSVYTSLAESVTYGSTGCFPPGPAGPEGPITQTTFLVIVMPCNPAKATSQTQTQKIAKPTFNMYPNPTTDKVFVEMPDEAIYQIRLMDVSGKMIKEIESDTDTSTIEINVQGFPKGMYLMALQSEDQQIIQKLIIE